MKLYSLHREQWVPQSVETVFPFFAAAENLQRLTPPSLDMEILTPGPLKMAAGAVFDYCIKTQGVPMRWTTYISEYDPPHGFVDVQLRGPYSFWHHTHRFEAHDGGTRITDSVRYALPFGPVGALVHWFYIGRQLEAIFSFRRAAVEGLWGTEPTGSAGS